MGATASAVRLRHDLHARLLEARSRTDELFRVVRDEFIYERPIPERHRLVFYIGHVEAFDWNLLAERAFGLRPFQRTFDQLFAFGIDPLGGGLPTDSPHDWPERDEIERYKHRLRDELDAAIDRALEHPSEGHPNLSTMLEVALEHRLMHAETLAYLLHRMPSSKKIKGATALAQKISPTKSRLVDVPAGHVTLGLQRVNGDEFGWDNEMEAHDASVDDFSIETHNVTNGDFLRFIQAGGYEN